MANELCQNIKPKDFEKFQNWDNNQNFSSYVKYFSTVEYPVIIDQVFFFFFSKKFKID